MECDPAKRPAPARRCYLRPCSAWKTGEWSKVSWPLWNRSYLKAFIAQVSYCKDTTCIPGAHVEQDNRKQEIMCFINIYCIYFCLYKIYILYQSINKTIKGLCKVQQFKSDYSNTTITTGKELGMAVQQLLPMFAMTPSTTRTINCALQTHFLYKMLFLA